MQSGLHNQSSIDSSQFIDVNLVNIKLSFWENDKSYHVIIKIMSVLQVVYVDSLVINTNPDASNWQSEVSKITHNESEQY